MAPDADAALMLAFQQGDEGAFRRLFERHARSMVSFCHHFVRDSARAEELAQDVFVKLYRAADRYEPSARFKTFLYRIASNHCLNELRRGEYAARAASRTKWWQNPTMALACLSKSVRNAASSPCWKASMRAASASGAIRDLEHARRAEVADPPSPSGEPPPGSGRRCPRRRAPRPGS